MKWLRYAAGILTLFGLVLSCASDIVLPEPPEIAGEYQGVYTVVIISPQEDTLQQPINWIFDGEYNKYNMLMDTLSPEFIPPDQGGTCFCIVYGKYTVEEKVNLRQEGDGTVYGDVGCNTCELDYNPIGAFELFRSKNQDTLTLKLEEEIDNERRLKIITLVHRPEEE
ncbi:MAG: hypothetical protein AB1744_02205 [Candidatus Zixiibacteriota bacterium]